MQIRPCRFRLLAGLALAVALAACASPRAVASAPAGAVARYFDTGLAPHKETFPTRVRLLTENDEAWYARWYATSTARRTLDIHYFSFKEDVFGKALLGLVRHKARQGVKVRLMVDDRGSFGLAQRLLQQEWLRELACQTGAEVRVFKPLSGVIASLPRDLRSYVVSNHDKILVADRSLAIVGGRNLRDSYFADPEDDPTAYRDNDVLLGGEGVGTQVARAFEEEFERPVNRVIEGGDPDDTAAEGIELELARRVMDRWISGLGSYPEEGPYRRMIARLNREIGSHGRLAGYTAFAADPWQGRREYPGKILDKHSLGDPRNDITPNLLALIDAAEHRITIQSAYVVLTPEAKAALVRAGRRGVAITILTNSPVSTDSVFTQAFFLREWWELLRDIPGLRLFMFTGRRKIHAKTLVFDDTVTCVGSYNLDPMSEELNSEVVAFVRSPEVSTRLRLRIEADLSEATECKIKVHADGSIEKLVGPGDFLRGVSGILVKLLSKLTFLRPIV